MSKEWKRAIIFLGVGLLILIGVKYLKDKKAPLKKEKNFKEKIFFGDNKRYSNIKEVKEYLERIKKAYSSGLLCVPLEESELNSDTKRVQDILLKNREFLSDGIFEGKVVHTEIMRISRAPIASIKDKFKKVCQKDRCYIATKYNFFSNSTTMALVDLDKKEVLDISYYPNMQPDINRALTRVAKAIAINAKEVEKELGYKPSLNEVTMANVRTILKGSICENKNHLCVAPTFANHNLQKALWAIVDLTDLKLVAAKWAGLGKSTTPACIQERSLKNRYISENFCQKDSSFKKFGWEFKYHLTPSDGLEIRDLKFKGEKVAKSLKIVDWHVAYKELGKIERNHVEYFEGRRVEFIKSNDGFLFGYNDAMGCPLFSTSVVLAFNAPTIKPLIKDNKEVGFYIVQDFRNPKWPLACNYRYQNRFEFYKDGSFRVVGINMGRGCGDNAIYRPVMRLDIDLNNRENFAIYKDGIWEHKKREFKYISTSNEKRYLNKYLYKIFNKKYTIFVEPNRGEFNDNSRGDFEHIFVTKFHPNEGDQDLLTIGNCCDLKIDGVERFLNNENIVDSDIVFWYVPYIKNDSRKGHEYCWADTRVDKFGNPYIKVWPCVVGPKFKFIKGKDR